LSQERLREAKFLVNQTGEVNEAILNDMLGHNDQFLGRIKDVPVDQQEELLTDGVRVFHQQRQELNELNSSALPLSDQDRARLRDFVGEAGDDQAIAEEVRNNLDLASMIPTQVPRTPTTEAPKPSPTTASPIEAPVLVPPTALPPTATPEPLTATPTRRVEMGMEVLRPDAELLPTATSTSTAPPPAQELSPPQPAVPVQPPAEPTTAPPVEPTTALPVELEPTLSPTPEIIMPALPALQTPAP
jgi:hypothetical protein